MKDELTVGQEVWVVLSRDWMRRRGVPQRMSITRIGRKWIELADGRYRFAVGSRRLDGGNSGYGSPGSVWLTREGWAAEEAFDHAWRKLQDSVKHHSTDGLTLGDIRAAAKTLRIELPEWKDPESKEQ